MHFTGDISCTFMHHWVLINIPYYFCTNISLVWSKLDNVTIHARPPGACAITSISQQEQTILFCDSETDDFATLCSTADKQLFNRILNQPEHVLHSLLPPPSASQYNLRLRPHNRLLCQRASRLTDCNFIIRMLYTDMYWLTLRICYYFVFFACGSAFWHFCN